MSTLRGHETCGVCGASIEVSSSWPPDVHRQLNSFRDAHAICRANATPYAGPPTTAEQREAIGVEQPAAEERE